MNKEENQNKLYFSRMFGSLVSVFSGNATYFRPFKSVFPVACKVNFVLPVLGPTTVRDTAAMVGDTFLDPFATMTWRQKEVLNETFNKSNYVLYKGADAIDFRGDNDTNIESLKKNSIDLYAATKSLYLQNKKNKIENSTGNEEDGWGNLDK